MPKKKTATRKKPAKKAAAGKRADGLPPKPKGAVKTTAVWKKSAPAKAGPGNATGTKRKVTAASPNEAMVVIAKGDRAMHEIARDLRAAGFQVGDVLEALGQVTGHAPANLKSRLKKIRGVEDVTGSHPDFDIGAPGAPVS